MCRRVLFVGKEGDRKIIQVQTTKRSVSVYKLTYCKDCDTGRCLQARKEMGQSIKFRQEVSECVQTYRLHRLCHRELFTGKEGDRQINQVQTTKWSVSVHKLTFCIDCATGSFLQARRKIKSISDNKVVSVYKLTSCKVCDTGRCLQASKEMGKSIKFRQEVSECVQTYRLHRLCHMVLLEMWENQSISDNKVVSECAQTYLLHRLCHRELFAGKEENQVNFRQQSGECVQTYQLQSL